MIDIVSLNSLCSQQMVQERGLQEEEGGRFCSRKRASVGAVADGEVTRHVTDYVSPAGPGYVVTFSYEKEGKKWRRVLNVGPEARREMTWFEEVKPKLR